MKKSIFKMAAAVLAVFCIFQVKLTAQAGNEATIKNGVYAGDISLAGMTAVEAENAIAEYVAGLQEAVITLQAAQGNEVAVTGEELQVVWANPELVQEAVELGTQGNVIQRYKAIKDLEHRNKVYDIELDFDKEALTAILTEKCTAFDKEAVNVALKRENGEFSVVEGKEGYALNVEASADKVYNTLKEAEQLDGSVIVLDISVVEPKGSAEELAQVKDLLGSFTTSFASSNSNRKENVQNGCSFIDGTTLYPGEEFSGIDTLSPFTAANGYYPAGTYLNGKVVDGLAGGICQVTTTLYNAVLLAELEVTMRYNHSMMVSYVDASADAAIASSAGKDFKFVNNTGSPVYIEGYVSSNKTLTFNIYGVESRDPSRTVEYVSEVLEVIRPETEVIYADAGKPLGSIVVDGAHTGYKARLWKVVKENGVEVSREKVNSSSYKMVPRSATVGVATSDPNAYNEIMAAIGTNSIDHVKNVIAILTAPPAPPAEEQPAQ